jgi:hypothetical protein
MPLILQAHIYYSKTFDSGCINNFGVKDKSYISAKSLCVALAYWLNPFVF